MAYGFSPPSPPSRRTIACEPHVQSPADAAGRFPRSVSRTLHLPTSAREWMTCRLQPGSPASSGRAVNEGAASVAPPAGMPFMGAAAFMAAFLAPSWKPTPSWEPDAGDGRAHGARPSAPLIDFITSPATSPGLRGGPRVPAAPARRTCPERSPCGGMLPPEEEPPEPPPHMPPPPEGGGVLKA